MISGERNKDKLYYRHEENEKKRCPCCGSLETKKNGYTYSEILTKRGKTKRELHRYFCKACGKSFSSAGYDVRKRVCDEIRKEAVLDYVCTKSSASEVGKRYGVTKMSVLNWMNQNADDFPKLEELNKDEAWSGYITLDGKEIKIRKQRRVIFTASDAVLKKPLFYKVYDSEDSANTRDFIQEVKDAYPIEIVGVTSDFGRGKCFVKVIEKQLPQALHQICHVHFKRYVWLFLPKTRRSQYFWRNNVLKYLINKVLDAPTREESLNWLEQFKKRIKFFKASYHKRFICSLLRNYAALTAHYENPAIVKTSNVSENLNRQLERKLKNTDGFKTESNLLSFLKIWFVQNRKNRHN